MASRATPPLNGSAFTSLSLPRCQGQGWAEDSAVALPVPSQSCQAGGGGSPCMGISLHPSCSGCLVGCRAHCDPRAGPAVGCSQARAGPLPADPTPAPTQPDDRAPACAAGRPRELSPRQGHISAVCGRWAWQAVQGLAGRFLLALVGLTGLGSGFQFRS